MSRTRPLDRWSPTFISWLHISTITSGGLYSWFLQGTAFLFHLGALHARTASRNRKGDAMTMTMSEQHFAARVQPGRWSRAWTASNNDAQHSAFGFTHYKERVITRNANKNA